MYRYSFPSSLPRTLSRLRTRAIFSMTVTALVRVIYVFTTSNTILEGDRNLSLRNDNLLRGRWKKIFYGVVIL